MMLPLPMPPESKVQGHAGFALAADARGAVALEEACRLAYAAAARSAKAGLDYAGAFHQMMQACGFERGDACTCGWAYIKRHTLECGYEEYTNAG